MPRIRITLAVILLLKIYKKRQIFPKMSKTYHWCIVPQCTSTSIKNKDKVFIQVPTDVRIRKKWFDAIRRDFTAMTSKTGVLFVCEDHFELERDMDNYFMWKYMKCRKIMKKDVVPHKFNCQTDRKRAFTNPPRSAAVKRQKLQILRESLSTQSTSIIENSKMEEIENPIVIEQFSTNEEVENITSNSCKTRDVKIMAKPHIRSNVRMVSKDCSPLKIEQKDKGTSPIKSLCIQRSASLTFRQPKFENKLISSDESDTASTYEPSSFTSTCGSEESVDYEEFARNAIQHTTKLVTMKPRLYLGITKECLFLIDLIERHTKLDRTSICLTLQKIRLGQTFNELGDAYGTSESNSSRKFTKAAPLIAQLMKELIITPPKDKVQKLLSLPFRDRYSKVQCIIDCFEIEIQKPSNAIKQALTWSEYKKANTFKYLLSSTPNGIITFVSIGFGGRTSDVLIVEKSGFLDTLESNSIIMADRGFKHIQNLLDLKNCRLLRPPSVIAQQKLNKNEVLETKRIASLRIHIERVIRRLREFKLLKPHSCVNTKLLPFLDDAVVIACGLVNTQGPIVK